MDMVESETKKVSRTQGGVKAETSIDAIRSEIGQYLQVNNINFLIGAGCSSHQVPDENGKLVENGIPGMAKLYEGFYSSYPNFEIAHKQTKDKFNSNLENMLESMLSVSVTNNITVIDEEIDEKILKVKNYILSKIREGQDSLEVYDLYKSFYMRISNSNRKSPINIFTTNYDLFNEKALDDLRFPYNNGFSGTYCRRFNPASYRYALVEDMNLSNDVWERVPHYFNLYKLHGSTSWKKDGNDIVEINPTDPKNDDTVMIYPTPMKDRSTLMTPYSDLFRAMENSISKSNSVLITMGYSFGDEHINHLIINALAVPSFRLIVFGSSYMIDQLNELRDNRIIVINSDDKIHYFKNIIQYLLPPISEEIYEKTEGIKTSEATKVL